MWALEVEYELDTCMLHVALDLRYSDTSWIWTINAHLRRTPSRLIDHRLLCTSPHLRMRAERG